MNKIFMFILAFILISATFYFCYNHSGNYVTKSHFDETAQNFNLRIDSLMQKIDSLSLNSKNNFDTLKCGQKAIFESMQENKNKTLLETIKFW